MVGTRRHLQYSADKPATKLDHFDNVVLVGLGNARQLFCCRSSPEQTSYSLQNFVCAFRFTIFLFQALNLSNTTRGNTAC